jgi:putative N6-adenine-specific DNA methylase
LFQYQKYNQYFGKATTNTEELCIEELEQLGATRLRKAYRGVFFCADHAALYRINYCSRLLIRVHAPLISFACHSPKYLKKTAQNVAWEQILSLEKTFAISASVANSAIRHSLYAAQCLKDGIADYFNAKYGKRPSVDTDNPDVRLNLHIESNHAVVSLDVSGESLHKRGYRLAAGLAPMQETLAAALIRISEWDGALPFWDPMCGSGTIVCEALMHYCRIPAQYLRKSFGFMHMPDYDPTLWTQVRKECNQAIRPLPEGLIRGSDKSDKMIDIARQNIQCLPNHENIKLQTAAFQSAPALKEGIIICNPPYGIRLGNPDDVRQLYTEFGNFLKQRCKGSSAYIFIGDLSMRKDIGLKPAKVYPLQNGSIDGELVRIDSYRDIVAKKAAPDSL